MNWLIHRLVLASSVFFVISNGALLIASISDSADHALLITSDVAVAILILISCVLKSSYWNKSVMVSRSADCLRYHRQFCVLMLHSSHTVWRFTSFASFLTLSINATVQVRLRCFPSAL